MASRCRSSRTRPRASTARWRRRASGSWVRAFMASRCRSSRTRPRARRTEALTAGDRSLIRGDRSAIPPASRIRPTARAARARTRGSGSDRNRLSFPLPRLRWASRSSMTRNMLVAGSVLIRTGGVLFTGETGFEDSVLQPAPQIHRGIHTEMNRKHAKEA